MAGQQQIFWDVALMRDRKAFQGRDVYDKAARGKAFRMPDRSAKSSIFAAKAGEPRRLRGLPR